MIPVFDHEDHTRQSSYEELEFDARDGVQLLSPEDSDYPASLIRWPGRRAPGPLFCEGDTGLFREHPLVMICGARDASQPALKMAGHCASRCGQAGVPVVSGLARGVDRAAHHEVLLAGGCTIAVLPFGIGRLPYDETLVGFMGDRRVLIASELKPHAHFTVGHALRRNRVMVALSDVVIVVEPGDTGGTWSSAKAAREFGRPLFFIAGERPECAEQLLRLGGRPLPMESDGSPDIATVLAEIGAG